MIGKYFAQARFYDSTQGRMLSPDPIKRGLNPYPYCDNDPVNYVDPTGEIANILAGAGIGGLFGGAAGFVGGAVSQIGNGRKFDWRKAAGAAANGAVVGAAKGALIGSGAGIPLAFATDFATGSIGNALEQRITTGRVDLGESLISGAGNALSEVLYGTGEIKGLKNAIWRGALTGAVMSGLESTNYRGLAGAILYDRMHNRKAMPESAGRDPKGMCGSPDPFDLASGLENGRGYRTGNNPNRASVGSGFSLGGFAWDVATGAVIGGLGSAAFYGVGQAVDALKSSVIGRKSRPKLEVRDRKFLNAAGDIDWNTWAPNGGRVPGTVREKQTINAGVIIDRYGNPSGRYVSPVGVPYEQRALPYVENPNAYHRYKVLKTIDNVTISQIAEAFEQPGGGIQYELPLTVKKLIRRRVLKEIR